MQVTESDAVDVIEIAIKRHASDLTTKAMALIALLKLSSRFPSCSEYVDVSAASILVLFPSFSAIFKMYFFLVSLLFTRPHNVLGDHRCDSYVCILLHVYMHADTIRSKNVEPNGNFMICIHTCQAVSIFSKMRGNCFWRNVPKE